MDTFYVQVFKEITYFTFLNIPAKIGNWTFNRNILFSATISKKCMIDITSHDGEGISILQLMMCFSIETLNCHIFFYGLLLYCHRELDDPQI